MKLATGERLGPYEIISQLGAGGMGEVYRARDTRLNRDVAIKVLPGDVAADSDRVWRLQQEAHLLRSEIDEAAHWYEVTIDQRELFAVMFPSYPVVAPLRESQYWPRLATLMKLPPVLTDVVV